MLAHANHSSRTFPRPAEADATPDVSFDADLVNVLSAFQLQAGATFGLMISGAAGEFQPLLASSGFVPPAQALGELVASVQRNRTVFRDGVERDAAMSWLEVPPGICARLLCLQVPLGQGGRVTIALGFGHETEFEIFEVAGAAAKRLLPFLRCYVQLWDRHHSERQMVTGLSDALDQSDIAILILDADGRVQFANRSARGLVDAQDGLRFSNGTVVATSLSDAIRLQVTIEHVVARRMISPRPERATAHVLLLHRAGNKRPLVATLVEAGVGARERTDAAAILYLVKPEHDLGPFVSSVCQLHKLSPAETRLARHLVMGMTLAEASAALRVKQHTARAYLKQIFLKTETHRQADLMRLMLSSLVPMPDRFVPMGVA